MINRTAMHHGIVTNRKTGEIRLIDEPTPPIPKFLTLADARKHENGTKLELHFRISENGKNFNMVFSKAVSDSAVHAAVMEEESATLDEFPEWIGDFYFDDSMRQFLSICSASMKAGRILNVAAFGDSGAGKTTLFQKFAQHEGYKFVRINCALMSDTQEWFGTLGAVSGSTVFTHSPFIEALQAGGHVIILDEFNRIEPWVANALFPLLDDARATTFRDMAFAAAPPLLFAMTMNIGEHFTGTFSIDAALKNRAAMAIHVEFPSPDREVQILRRRYDTLSPTNASSIVKVMQALRKTAREGNLSIDLSPRTSLNIASIVILGCKISEAFHYGVINLAEEHERKALLDTLNIVMRG